MTRPSLLVFLLLLPGLCSVAEASVRPPVGVDLAAHAMEARGGVEYRGTFVITARPGDSIQFITLHGQGWSDAHVDVPDGLTVPASGQVPVPFRATPENPDQTLRVTFVWNQRQLDFPLDLSPRAYRRATQISGLLRLGGAEATSAPKGGHTLGRRFDPAPYTGDSFAPQAQPAPEGAPGAQANKDFSITVTGRLVYTRDDPSSLETAPAVTVGADGATVEIYDDDLIGKKFIASTTTDEDGYFSRTFTWNTCFTCEDNPDIKVEFHSENGLITVKNGLYIDKWETDTEDNVGAGTLDIGTVTPADEDTHPALHLLTVLGHTWDYMLDQGYAPAPTTLKWDEDNNGTSYYSNGTIHMDSSDSWSESVVAHEFGHRWIDVNATSVEPDYCNSTCDQGNGCGHCMWCNETAHDAYNEGWPNWLGAVVARDLSAEYGVTLTNTNIYNFENLRTCVDSNGNPCTCTAASAEGFIAALLTDLEDSPADDNNSADSWQDELSLGADEIFEVAALDEPTTARGFVDAFHDRFPSHEQKLWKLATDIGFTNLDTVDPTNPTMINAISHDVGTSSADPTIEFEWSGHGDDYSGVMGFSVEISSATTLPNTTVDVTVDGASTGSYTTPVLAPGFYVINIRTQDRAGNWSDSFVSAGPYEIREPYPADLATTTPTGWDEPLVPRDDATATANNVQVSTWLDGDLGVTYWNAAIRNIGELVTESGFYTRLSLDGRQVAVADGGRIHTNSLNALTTLQRLNEGPIVVRGGRHRLSYRIDSHDDLPEAGETDNEWGRQWVWTPITLPPGQLVDREAPPDPQGGHPEGMLFLYPNCDGLRITSSIGEYHAVVAWTDDPADDYSLRLHPAASSPTDGFEWPTATSTRAGGELIDALLVNQVAAPSSATWDIGVVHADGPGSGGYTAQHVIGERLFRNTPVSLALDANERLALGYMVLGLGQLGGNTVTVTVDPSAGVFNVAWFPVGFGQGGLEDATETVRTDENGLARVSFSALAFGRIGLAIWRDPADDPAAKALSAVDIDVTWTAGMGDLYVPATRAGWYSTLAPTPFQVTAVGQVAAAPLELLGDGSTYMNVSIGNSGVGTVSSVDLAFLVDGVVRRVRSTPSIPAGSMAGLFDGQPLVISGGRHTLGEILDFNGDVEELGESNNRAALQFKWSGPDLDANASEVRPSPPAPTGGWSDIPGGAGALWYACDGFSLPYQPNASRFQAVAVLPDTGGDVDVRLHDPVAGIYDGFDVSLAHSGWGPDESDFVVWNLERSGTGDLDAGVIDASGAATGYRIQRVDGRAWGPAPVQTPTLAFSDTQIVDLHEVSLMPGEYLVTVQSIDGSVDWGVAVHPNDETFVTKSNALADAAAWGAGEGQDESVLVTIDTAGRYCVSVWRVDNAGLAPAASDGSRKAAKALAAGSYVLRVGPATTAVGPGAAHVRPATTALRTVAPNPFNPRTTVAFEVAASGPVQLELFNARGERVRRLVDQVLDAGVHAAEWDGRDDAGRPVSSGTYLVQLRAGSTVSVRKAMLTK